MIASDTKPVSDDIRPVRLGEFVEQYQKLISVLGVFTALTVFSKGLPIPIFGQLLGFLFLATTILLWNELIRSLPERKEWSLTIFHNLVSGIMVAVGAYWVIDFREIWRGALGGLVGLVFVGIWGSVLRLLVRRYRMIDGWLQPPPSMNRWQGIVRATALWISLFFFYYLGFVVAPPINRAMDKVYRGVVLPQDETVESPTPRK